MCKALVPTVIGLVVLASGGAAQAQQRPADGPWTTLPAVSAPELAAASALGPPLRTARLRSFQPLGADEDRLRGLLAAAPREFSGEPAAVFTVPLPDGTFERVSIEESPIFSPELQARHADIRTYRALGIDDPTLTGRLDTTPAGFHAILITRRGTVYVDPVDGGGQYVSYWKQDAIGEPFSCDTHRDDAGPVESLIGALGGEAAAPALLAATNPSGSVLRTYRLAVSVTGEYTRHFDGTPPTAGTPNTVNQIATTVNRVTGIYERDLAIRLQLVATRIFTDPATDPFSSGDFRTENQTELDANVGNANYDIGHVFSQGGSGGVASLGVVCVGGNKARGYTSRPNPSGDPFDVDYVAHEMGHQFGGNHTWTSNTGSCADAGQFVASAAYEPGSGSTVMAYAGICGPQNVQANSDDYFHTHNYDEIVAFRTSGQGSTCGTTAATGNAAPTVDAGPACTVPQSTPFTLTASGSDPDGDSLTYLWEQFDLGPYGQLPQAANTTGPLFRSRPALSSPSRTFPRLQDILSGAATPWEVLPAVDRTLNFRVTARDNRVAGGGVDYDSTTVTVSGAPFAFTFPVLGSTLECGGSATVTWTVGGGSVAPDVALLFSGDNGSSFSTLVGSTANDGSHAVTVPQSLTADGRLQLVPSAQCFFAMSRRFSVVDTTPPSLTVPVDVLAECTQESPQGATPSIGVATATDLCDASLVITENVPDLFPLGTTVVTWTATDDSLNTASGNQSVTVVDTTPPTIVAPAAVVAECTSPAGTPVAIGTATADDVCWASLTVSSNAPPLFPLGTTTVTWTAQDGSANTASATQPVTVQDTTPPTLSVSLSPTALWPANHRLVRVVATIDAADI
jgi:hypothetical protein